MVKHTHEREAFSDVTRNRHDEVDIRYEDGEYVPAVCVKVRGRLLDRVPRDVAEAPDKIRSAAYDYVVEDWWRGTPQELAREYLAAPFRGRKIEARGVGRSSGWVAVFGIGTPGNWTPKQLKAWRDFEAQIESTIEDAEALFVMRAGAQVTRFQSKGPYVAFGLRNNCIGGFDTIAEAKHACARDELAPMGRWKAEDNSFGRAYHADSGCSIYVGYDHPRVKLTREEIEKATARFHWREGLR